MLVNNNQRLEIFLSMKNRFDYQEFVLLCEMAGVEPLPWVEYAQKAETVMFAQEVYPDLPPGEAYLKLVGESQGTLPKVRHKSRGLGDTVAKLTHALGIDRLAETYTAATGKECGCAGRQEKLNELFPYKGKAQ